MKKKLNLSLFVVLLFLITFGGCKKYPEGPYLSFRSKTERVAGLWHFSSVKINDVEQNLSQNIGLFPSYDKQSIEFTKDGLIVWAWEAYSFFPAGSTKGEWKFSSDKYKILIKMEGDIDWKEKEILKLKNNEFWYKETVGNATTEIHLETF